MLGFLIVKWGLRETLLILRILEFRAKDQATANAKFKYSGPRLKGCDEINGSELKFRYNQGFVTDKVLYIIYN